MGTDIVYVDPGLPGYQPVRYMAQLAARCFESELIVVTPASRPSVGDLAKALLPVEPTGRTCILICPQPGQLAWGFILKRVRRKYRHVVGWAFDSFWVRYLPRYMRFFDVFDYVFVTEQEDLDTWRRALPAPVDWLPWGSDVLGLGSSNGMRGVDLMRFGRQPPEWDDDRRTEDICRGVGIRFQGRPQYSVDPEQNQRQLMMALASSKYTLSFSNRVSPAPQTHPDREYLTARWTDAVSAGAIVAGIRPRSPTVDAVLWPGATLDLGSSVRELGVQVLREHVRLWEPKLAQNNYLQALKTLDWRLRFQRLSEALGESTSTLDQDLARLRSTVMQCEQGS